MNTIDYSLLLKLYIPTSAFVVAIYTLFLRDSRIKDYSSGLLNSLVFLFLSIITELLTVILTLSSFNFIVSIIKILHVTSISLFIFSLYLVLLTIIKTHTSLFYLRSHHYFKCLPFIRAISSYFEKDRFLLKGMKNRKKANQLKFFRKYFSNGEYKELLNGFSSLFLSSNISLCRKAASDIIIEGLENGEAITYVCCSKNAKLIWDEINSCNKIPEDYYQSIIFVDSFVLDYGFEDNIIKDSNSLLKTIGISVINSKGISGLHSGISTASRMIKKMEKKVKGSSKRRPLRVIYDSVSFLEYSSSIEQLKVFMIHMLAAEKGYGIITVILEQSILQQGLSNFLSSLVDTIFEIKSNEVNRLK